MAGLLFDAPQPHSDMQRNRASRSAQVLFVFMFSSSVLFIYAYKYHALRLIGRGKGRNVPAFKRKIHLYSNIEYFSSQACGAVFPLKTHKKGARVSSRYGQFE
jgi:hypothetical protein